MRNFFVTQKFLFNFHFRHFRKRCCLSKCSRKFRRFLRHSFCRRTRKIILKNLHLIHYHKHYYNNPRSLLEDLYISLDMYNIDLQKLPASFSVRKKSEKIYEQMKWLQTKEGIDLP